LTLSDDPPNHHHVRDMAHAHGVLTDVPVRHVEFGPTAVNSANLVEYVAHLQQTDEAVVRGGGFVLLRPTTSNPDARRALVRATPANAHGVPGLPADTFLTRTPQTVTVRRHPTREVRARAQEEGIRDGSFLMDSVPAGCGPAADVLADAADMHAELAHDKYRELTPDEWWARHELRMRSAVSARTAPVYLVADNLDVYEADAPVNVGHLHRHGPMSVLEEDELVAGVQVRS